MSLKKKTKQPNVAGSKDSRNRAIKKQATVRQKNKTRANRGASINGNIVKQVLLVVLCLIVTTLVHLNISNPAPQLSIGDLANNDVRAKKDILIEDPQATKQNKEKALEEAPLFFDFDTRAQARAKKGIHKVFEILRKAQKDPFLAGLTSVDQKALEKTSDDQEMPSAEVLQDAKKNPATETFYEGLVAGIVTMQKMREVRAKTLAELETALGTEIFPGVFNLLLKLPVDQDSESKLSRTVSDILSDGIVISKTFLSNPGTHPVFFRDIHTGEEYRVSDLSKLKNLEGAREELKELLSGSLTSADKTQIKLYEFLGGKFIQPNVTFNRNETERRKQLALDSVRPVFYKIKKGELVIRKGEKIGPEQYMTLLALHQQTNRSKKLISFVGVFLISMIIIWIITFVAMNHLEVFPRETRDFCFLFCLFVFFIVGLRLYEFVSEALATTFSFIHSEGVLFSYPLASAAILTSIIFNVETALVISLLLSLLAGIILGNNFGLFFFFLVGSFVGARGVAECRDRITPIKTGFFVGLLNAVIAGVLTLMNENITPAVAGANLSFALLGGVLSGVIATGLAPLAEMLFQYTTDIKLLELANLDHPLLRELMIQAPGTYHHSIIVGNMVEAAARAINANSLLARVAAYYHDIGKIKKPLYFVENQKEGENRHEKLAPSMSSLILISHVKDGVDLARKHNLGKPIMDIIQQHHGTSLISFFYQKALKMRERTKADKGSDPPPVNIENYRYPGPKPQTKEAGLVMLADCVEAASKSLPEGAPAKVQGLVHRMINKIFTDGELDECELTLKDLHQIAQQFNKILTGIYHKRIEYPDQAKNGTQKEKANGDTGKRTGRSERDQQTGSGEKGKENIKRLGLYRG